MKICLFSTLRNYKKEYLTQDLFSGIIIAAVSIPISMGYSQIAGLPAVYGLYGSVLPILFFALFSTSRQFIFGVDAAPAAIVGAALLNVVEAHLALRLFRVSRQEFFIFMAAGAAVLFLGTIYGVVAGILLSFTAVILKATNPPRNFLGMIPGKKEFYPLDKNRFACPLKEVQIYRFSENLFFANIKILQEEIENSIQKDTKAVILDAGAVNSLDITAADGLERLAESLKRKNIRFYITEHSENVNEQMRRLGIGHLIREGCVRRTILAALHDLGLKEPFPLEISREKAESLGRESLLSLTQEEEKSLEEFTWAFGTETVREIEKRVKYVVNQIHGIADIEELSKAGPEEKMEFWHSLGPLDEDELLRRLELHIEEFPPEVKVKSNLVVSLIEKRRQLLREKLLKDHPSVRKHLEKKQAVLEQRLEKQNPEGLRRLHQLENQSSLSDTDTL